VDYNNTNSASSSECDNPGGSFDTAWNTGINNLAAGVRAKLGDKLIVGNTGGAPGSQGPYLNGGMIEGVDQDGTNPFVGDPASNFSALPFYNAWMDAGHSPATFIFLGTTYNDLPLENVRTNYRAVRYLLALALMRDSFFAYDDYAPPNYGHQTTWWYDEYDNAGAGTGYLGYPKGPATFSNGVYRRDFDHGISLANTNATNVTVSLERTYKKIAGTQAPSVNDGSMVTSVTLGAKDGIILLDTGDSTATPTSTATATPTATQTPTPTSTATDTPTMTPTVTPTPTSTNTATPSQTSTATSTSTSTPTATDALTTTQSPTPTNTATPAPGATNTPTGTPTQTATPSATATANLEPAAISTATPTATATSPATSTPTVTPTPQQGVQTTIVYIPAARDAFTRGLEPRPRFTGRAVLRIGHAYQQATD
jgi:hypothetical protein